MRGKLRQAHTKALALLREIRDRGGLTDRELSQFNDLEYSSPPVAENVLKHAINIYESDDVNIDNDAYISQGDDGCWVSAWVWVQNEEVDDA